MNVGDFIYDVTLRLNGLIIGETGQVSSGPFVSPKWIIFYEDGRTDEACEIELEIHSEEVIDD